MKQPVAFERRRCALRAHFLFGLSIMLPINTAAWRTPKRRVTIYYFFQAMSVGVVNSFAGIWFASQDIREEQIGLITAAPLVVILAIGVLVGRLADRAPDWRQVIVWGGIASGLAALPLFFATGFWSILFIWTLAVTMQMAVLPIIDAASIRLGRRTGFDFSPLYAWKTIGYMLTILVAGFIVARFGISAFLPMFVGLTLVRTATAFTLPRFREPKGVASSNTASASLRDVLHPWFLFPLAGWSLVHSTHFVLNGFLGLLWHDQGISESMIGLLIAIGSIAELAMFVGFKHFTARISPQTLIFISCVVAVVRWTAFAFSPPISVLFALQLLQAVTYALGFLACTHFIADLSDEAIAAQAQSLFGAMQSGVAILALVAFGWLAGQFGVYAFLASAGLAVSGALLVVVSTTFKK